MASDPSWVRRLRAVDQRITTDPDRRACGQAGLGALITGDAQPDIVGLVQTCGQNACPQCADRDLADRQRALTARMVHWRDHGLVLLGVTFSTPHRARDDFHTVRDWLDDALKAMFAGRRGRAFRRRWAIGPIDKSWETSHTLAGGPHPHVHAVLYLTVGAAEVDLAALTVALQERWAEVVATTGAPIRAWNQTSLGRRGVHVRDIPEPAAMAHYLTKRSVRTRADGSQQATGMFEFLERLADHEDRIGEPCYCDECKRHTAIWRAFADQRDPTSLPPDAPAAHAKRYAGRIRFSPARRFSEACAAAGIPALGSLPAAKPIDARCRIRYDALRLIREHHAVHQAVEAAVVGDVTEVRALVARLYEQDGLTPRNARIRAESQVTDPPPWTRRFGLAHSGVLPADSTRAFVSPSDVPRPVPYTDTRAGVSAGKPR